VPEKKTTTAPDGKPFGDRWTGQNLAMGSGSLSIEEAINMWDGEKRDYNFCANKGTPGKMIGHYTQVVWAETTHVGCGKTKCPNMELITCDYWPGGNTNPKQCRPYSSRCGDADRSRCSFEREWVQKSENTCSGEPISEQEEKEYIAKHKGADGGTADGGAADGGSSRALISILTLLAILVV